MLLNSPIRSNAITKIILEVSTKKFNAIVII